VRAPTIRSTLLVVSVAPPTVVSDPISFSLLAIEFVTLGRAHIDAVLTAVARLVFAAVEADTRRSRYS
jgi:hypothetical protein